MTLRQLRLVYGVWVFAVIVCWNPAHCEELEFSLLVYPRICMAKCDARIEVRVPRNDLNRYLFIGWDGPMSSSSLIQLDGNSEVIHQRMMLALPKGEYAVFTTLVRVNEKDHAKVDHINKRDRIIVN